jgi:hypothetical protein
MPVVVSMTVRFHLQPSALGFVRPMATFALFVQSTGVTTRLELAGGLAVILPIVLSK